MAARHLKIVVLALAVLAGTIPVAGCGDEAPPTAPANRAPAPQGLIPGQTVHVGEATTLDLSPYFRDPDGDGLAHVAASSAPAVVSASVSGSTLTIAGLATGTAQVTVTATDPGGLAATQGFEATVPNRPPELQGTIPAQTVKVGETITLDLPSYFSDPDGDALAYSAAASDASVASVSMSGSTLTIAGLATGTAQVTVTATDPGGLAATQGFEATVPNRPPELQGTIPAQTVKVGETITLDLPSYFSDPDGDALAYSAAASDASVASVSMSGSTLTLSGLAAGTAQVTVVATDPGGLAATQVFSLSVIAPGPDLVFTGVSPEFTTLSPGDSAIFTFTIHNQGTGSSEATTIRGMRSTNPIISPRDAVLRSHSFPPLAPRQVRTFQLTIFIDPRSAPGTIYIGMCLDPVPRESDTRNNCSVGARVTVTAQHAREVKQT